MVMKSLKPHLVITVYALHLGWPTWHVFDIVPGLEVNVLKNYIPVSNIPFIGKVLEKVVAKQLTQHLRDHDLGVDLQSAYHLGCSTETALMKIKADIDHILDQGQDVLLVTLDLSAVFDMIDHEILLERLHTYVGFTGTALS